MLRRCSPGPRDDTLDAILWRSGLDNGRQCYMLAGLGGNGAISSRASSAAIGAIMASAYNWWPIRGETDTPIS
jgi:hypothetical protein